VLIGAYGKGKSHIVLTILSILMKRDLALFEKLMPRIAENPRLNQLVQNYYESENKILPVVIQCQKDKIATPSRHKKKVAGGQFFIKKA
jgi:hypothetical protein